eukprot:scaffold94116_cov60-Phaeocystis_antarctica.AAC.3
MPAQVAAVWDESKGWSAARARLRHRLPRPSGGRLPDGGSLPSTGDSLPGTLKLQVGRAVVGRLRHPRLARMVAQRAHRAAHEQRAPHACCQGPRLRLATKLRGA